MQVGDDVDDIVCVAGSGGTAAGLAIANYINGSKHRLHAVSVCEDPPIFHDFINRMINIVGLKQVRSEDIISIHGDYIGEGYGRNQVHELGKIVYLSFVVCKIMSKFNKHIIVLVEFACSLRN